MIILEYSLPIAAALLIIIFFSGLPNLKCCRLSAEGETGGSRQFDRRDWVFILALTAVYGVTAFTNLGDRTAPETFAPMTEGSGAVFTLESDSAPSRIMLYTGIGVGTYDIEYSADGQNYELAVRFEQDHSQVLKWQSLTPETELRPRYVRIVCTSGSPYLGELTLLDGDGLPIAVSCDNEVLTDEQEKTPSRPSYMNSSYFDEIYHARTAWENLNGVWPYEISHPPLGKLLIALGISIFGMTPFGWRFMGTLFGVLMLPMMYVLLKRLFGGRAVPALGTIVFAADFMHFTQTRIATIDTYGVFFILLMYLFMYEFYSRGSWKCLALSGISFGLGAASKWTAIYAGAGLALLWGLYWIIRFCSSRPSAGAIQGSPAAPHPPESEDVPPASKPSPSGGRWPAGPNEAPPQGASPAHHSGHPPVLPLFLKNCLFCLVFFVLIPCLIYYLSYIPYGIAKGVSVFSRDYLQIVLDNQEFMFNYHSNVVAEHPYSSRWYQWILDIRPILYYLEYFDNGTRSSICAFLNPALCWAGFLSLFVLGYTAVFRRDKKAAFILIGYLSQLVPWMFIKRLTFEYHYFPSSLFLVMAISYVFELMRRNRKNWAVYVVPFAVVAALLFIMFYPALSGQPVNNDMGTALMGWLPTWPL